MAGLMGMVSGSTENAAAEATAEAQAAVSAPKNEIKEINGLSCVVVSETITFRACAADKRQQGLEYETVKDDKDASAPVLYRRKAETVELAFPLLSNFGMVGEFDQDSLKYADKTQNYIFSLIQAGIYSEAKSFIDDGKSFTLDDISISEIAQREPAKRGGRRSEIDQTMLEASIKAFAEWMETQGKSKQAIGLHVQTFKTRLRGTATWKPAILAKFGENLEKWFASLAVGEEQDAHKDSYEFLSAKITGVLEGQDDLEGM